MNKAIAAMQLLNVNIEERAAAREYLSSVRKEGNRGYGDMLRLLELDWSDARFMMIGLMQIMRLYGAKRSDMESFVCSMVRSYCRELEENPFMTRDLTRLNYLIRCLYAHVLQVREIYNWLLTREPDDEEAKLIERETDRRPTFTIDDDHLVLLRLYRLVIPPNMQFLIERYESKVLPLRCDCSALRNHWDHLLPLPDVYPKGNEERA